MIDPLEPLLPLVQGIGGLEQVARVRKGLWLSATTPRPELGVTPHTVIHQQNKLAVRFYGPEHAPSKAPVLIVPSMINKATICDLEPDRSLVASLAAAGHPTYLLDWGIPGPEDAAQTVADVLDLLHRALDRVCRHAGAPSAFLFGYCQGGTLSTIYTALRPARVRSLITLNAPVYFGAGGRFRQFVETNVLDVDAAFPKDRLVPVEAMQAAFKLLDPMGNWTKYIALEGASRSEEMLKRSMARERWLEENIPMPGAFANEFIKKTYQEDALLAGTWRIRGEKVDLKKITCPVWVITGEKDFITPKEAALPLLEAVSSADKRVDVLTAGHIGVIVGSFGPKKFYPMLDSYFREHA